MEGLRDCESFSLSRMPRATGQPMRDMQSPKPQPPTSTNPTITEPTDAFSVYYRELTNVFEWCKPCKEEHIEVIEKLMGEHYPGFSEFLHVSELLLF